MTIDYDLSFTSPAGLSADLKPEFAIIESKAARASGAADVALRRLRARPVKVSKYVMGLALLNGRVPNDLRPVARRFFSPPLAG